VLLSVLWGKKTRNSQVEGGEIKKPNGQGKYVDGGEDMVDSLGKLKMPSNAKHRGSRGGKGANGRKIKSAPIIWKKKKEKKKAGVKGKGKRRGGTKGSNEHSYKAIAIREKEIGRQ